LDDEPFDGDPSWRAVRQLRGGERVTIRPIVPEDRDELRRAFRATSARTRYLRFLGVVGDLTEEMLTYLTNVDQKDHVALVATITSPDLKTERGVGVARFIRLEDAPHSAEAAITVADDMQQKGVGTLLGHELERAARVRGIHCIRAEVAEDNATMRAILDHTGARRVEGDGDPGIVSYEIDLAPERISERLTRVLRGAAETMSYRIRRLVPPSATPAGEDDADHAERERE
jgi:RimJ/RimL family protein N-acetyltransferase